MTRQLLAVAVLALAMALGTAWVGWWAVPVFGGVWGVARYGAYPAATAAVGGALAWTLLLGVTALRGPAGEASRVLGGALSLPGWVPLLAAVLFPAALAGAAAALTHAVMPTSEGAGPPADHGPATGEES